VGAFVYRLTGAAMLNAGMYEGIEADRSATWQATLTVILASLAAGFGASGIYRDRLSTFVIVTAIALVTWAAWAVLTLQIGSRLLPAPTTDVTLGQLLRTTGFAAAPGLLLVFAVFPRMTIPVFASVGVWMIAAMIVAVKHALDYESTSRAVAVCVVAVAISLALAVLMGVMFTPTVAS
jgi:hypothetical protein